MKITRITAASLAGIALASGIALGTAPLASAASDPTLVVTVLPGQVRLIPGESIVLSQSTNATTGYRWTTKVTGNSAAIKVYEGVYAAPASTDGMVGVPGTTTWAIKALKPGKAKVQIIATSPGGSVEPGKSLTVIVMNKQ